MQTNDANEVKKLISEGGANETDKVENATGFNLDEPTKHADSTRHMIETNMSIDDDDEILDHMEQAGKNQHEFPATAKLKEVKESGKGCTTGAVKTT